MDEEYHHDKQGRARIILPPQGPLKKFVQVKIKNPEDFLFIGGRKLHVELLEETLKRFGLGYKGFLIKEGDDTRFKPNEDGENYLLIGAGSSEREGDIITLGFKSFDYDLWFDEENFNKRIKPYIPKEIKFKFEKFV